MIKPFTGFHFINNRRYHPKQHHLLGVDNDGTFSENYYLARDKARHHAEKRSKMFDAAADAIRKGYGALAGSLSEEGKWHGSMVDEYNSKAVDEILGPQENNHDSIDLHGLYESEAIDVVKDFLLDNPAKQVDVITGKGLHSEHGKGPVLQFAIQKLADSKGWKYRYDDGCFFIDSPALVNLTETDEHEGLPIGSTFPCETWASLRDLNDVAFKFSRLGKGIYPCAVVYIDPRRSSDQTRAVVDEFKQLSAICKNNSAQLYMKIQYIKTI
jgi:hypothetical protein